MIREGLEQAADAAAMIVSGEMAAAMNRFNGKKKEQEVIGMAGPFHAVRCRSLSEYADTKEDLCRGRGPVSVSGGTDSQKAHEMADAGTGLPP